MTLGSETRRGFETILGFGTRKAGCALSVLMLAGFGLGCGAEDTSTPPGAVQVPSDQMTGYEIILNYDLNGDGLLAAEEAPQDMWAGFDAMDANRDGVLTIDEIDGSRNPPAAGGTGGGGGQAGTWEPPPIDPVDPAWSQDPARPPMDEEDRCAETEMVAEREVPEVHLVVDMSSSMSEPAPNGQPKWVEACDAVKAVIFPLTESVAFGYHGYTYQNAACPQLVEEPAAQGNAEQVWQAMFNNPAPPVESWAMTPTAETLDVVNNQIQQNRDPENETAKLVLLVTDGMPNGCGMQAFQSGQGPSNTEMAARRLCENGVQMAVIWIGDMSDPNAGTHMQNMANLGAGSCNDTSITGTYYTVQTGQELQAVLSSLVRSVLSCVFELKGPGVDPVKACEDYRSSVTINGRALECAEHGWRLNDEHTLEIVGDACVYVQSQDEVEIKAEFPCEVQIT